MNIINKKGFSILEVSIVMGVVSIGLLGVFSLLMQNIQVQKVNKNILAASMLAQEGLELVRNVRDDNWLTAGNDWDKDIAGWGNNDFTVDYSMTLANGGDSDSDGNIVEETGANSSRLYLNVNNLYTHTSTGNTATQYYRLITVTGVDASNPADGVVDYYKVKSHVQWLDKTELRNYIAETYLYNWR